jgi:EthD protein.
VFKCIALLRRRPDLSRNDFIDYYETRHSVLIRRLLPGILDYRRNYVELEGAFLFPAASPIDFDVVTELWFADRDSYDRFAAAAAEPDIARQIAEDEKNLFDRSATRMFTVEEHASPAMADPLRALLDEREIVRGLSRFARVLDGKQWERLGDVFAEDIVFDYGSGKDAHGISALTDNMRRFLDRCGGTQHLLGSIAVDLDGTDRAVSRSYVQARHQRVDDPAGPIFDSSGEYVDVWERRRGGWRIVRRDAIWAAHSGDPGILAASTGDLG